MAFFNLTQLGAQDPFKIASSSNSLSPAAAHALKTQAQSPQAQVVTEGQSSPSQSTSEDRKEKPEATSRSSKEGCSCS